MKPLLPLIIVMTTIFSVTNILTQCNVNRHWKDKIVKQGCAEYYLDANYDRQWRWKNKEK